MKNDNKRDDLRGCADAMISLRHDDVMDDAAWINAMRTLVRCYEDALVMSRYDGTLGTLTVKGQDAKLYYSAMKANGND